MSETNPSSDIEARAPGVGEAVSAVSAAPRLGLAARTAAWMLALILLALSAAVLAHLTIDRLQVGLESMASDELDPLMDSVRLVQQSEALISQSLSLSQAQSQDERRRLRVDQQDRLEWIQKITRQLASSGHTDPDLLARVQRAQMQLGDGVETLDDLVNQRLRLWANEGEFGRKTAELDERIAKVSSQHRLVGAELSVLMGYFSSDIRTRMRSRIDRLEVEVNRQRAGLWVLTGAAAVLLALLGGYLHHTVVLRVLRLQRGVSQTPVDRQALHVGGNDEITRLAETVGHYVDRIQENELRLHRSNLDLAYLAEHDPLTRLANRRHFDAASRRMLAALGSPLALAVLDVDHFKVVNDTHGHDFGDLALIHLAHSLGTALRERDVLARFGGEEFVVLLPVSGMDAAVDVCERMRINVATQPVLHGDLPPVALNVSVGVALITDLPLLAEGDDAAAVIQQALRAADAALYRAKMMGRNQVCTAPEPISARMPFDQKDDT